MLKKLILKNWKSFRYAELPIDPLTILIGTNASGKSNAIEALDLLAQLAQGELLSNIFAEETTTIRGGANQVSIRDELDCSLGVVLQSTEPVPCDYKYFCTIEVSPELGIKAESWSVLSGDIQEGFSINSPIEFHGGNGSAKHPSKEGTKRIEFTPDDFRADLADSSWLPSLVRMYSFLGGPGNEKRAQEAGEILAQLKKIKIVRPVPSKIRGYSRVSSELNRDASNIAGFLSSLPNGRKLEVESILTSYIQKLSSQDVSRIWTETVGRDSTDAILYGEEHWGSSPLVIDSRSMSDGTLSFIAILTALLTFESGCQLVIEDIDDGLHPSRAKLLLQAIREIGEQRNIDVLVTTHNPALLDSLEQDFLPFVVVAHRDSHTGESLLTPLDKIENLPKLLASASLGDLATQGALERNLETEAIAP
jgi:predicted ATPase